MPEVDQSLTVTPTVSPYPIKMKIIKIMEMSKAPAQQPKSLNNTNIIEHI